MTIVLVEAPNGNRILIDGGPDDRILEKLGDTLPFWDRALDLVVLTHPHADHLTGLLGVIKRYRVGAVLESGVRHTTAEYAEWRRELAAAGAPLITARSGQRFWVSPGVIFEVLAPRHPMTDRSLSDIHDAMVVTKLTYASTTALFTGDAERSLERALVIAGADLDTDVLKVGHQGSNTSTFEEFLRATTPEVAVISVGAGNRYGHPSAAVLARLASFMIAVRRTDEEGDITIASDGRVFAY